MTKIKRMKGIARAGLPLGLLAMAATPAPAPTRLLHTTVR